MLADLRYALRQLLKSPGFTAIAILTLALGIGACSAIFSVVNAVLLKPLDDVDPARIVIIRETQLPQFPEFSVAPPNFLDWEKQTHSFESMAASTNSELNLTGAGEPERLVGVKATAHYFDVYGITPILGRVFLPEEDAVGKNHVVVVSYAFWQRALGGAGNVIGHSLQLNGEPCTIIGVTPRGFGLTNKTDAWVPMAFTADETSAGARGAHYLSVVARLRSGVTVA
ncbi:MAG: ABC transporter permease, partial [Verrucomicrobiota bacterium]|nr:ABC transporter permease [Verrucomicrobiota bacterium]